MDEWVWVGAVMPDGSILTPEQLGFRNATQGQSVEKTELEQDELLQSIMECDAELGSLNDRGVEALRRGKTN